MPAAPCTPTRRWVIVASLVVILGFSYYPVLSNDFVFFDDAEYILDNPHVASGLSWENIGWAFTQYHSHNWHPVTWISHMSDCLFFGLDPAGHHSVAVGIHALNAILLFFLLLRTTGAFYTSALVAAFWAVHPLHVESVAWASERKNLLSTLFWLLTMCSYVRYVETADDDPDRRSSLGGAGWYGLTLLLLALGLMAKQMLVTLPCVLFLCDIWPLQRKPFSSVPRLARLVAEKIPMLLLAFLAAYIVFRVQSAAGMVKAVADVGALERFNNSVLAYGLYIWNLLYPVRLAVFYPHLGSTASALTILIVLAALLCLTLAALLRVKRAPYATVGWLWYLGTLMPVIGLIQVGFQGKADRYMYVPSIGLLIALGWVLSSRFAQAPQRLRTVAVAAAGVVVLALAFATHAQARTWRNSETLLNHAIGAVPGNYWAHYNLGEHIQRRGDMPAAIAQYRAALEARPGFPQAHYNLGVALSAIGDTPAAMAAYAAAIQARPTYPHAHANYAALLAQSGKPDQAIRHYRHAIEYDPSVAEAHAGLAHLLLHYSHDPDGARYHVGQALKLRPGWAYALDLRHALDGAER